MRAESIVSSFIVVIGNALLHLAFFFLAFYVTVPSQYDIDLKVDEKVKEGDS